ncbi:MAG: DUF4255 domain-containing protein [Caldilineaceae bacterium]|nr:DUF4255 domain-containing protein [Caldilineaceae bacterium]
MANLFAIHSVLNSLTTFLRNSYPDELRNRFDCSFRLLSSGELETITDAETTLSLYLHRVTLNEHMRNQQRTNGNLQGRTILSLDLHFLLSVWTTSVLAEHTLMSWAMRQIHLHPALNASTLSPDAAWDAHDIVQIAPAELSNEELVRIWDRLKPSYRLSTPYLARVVRIAPDDVDDALPVVSTRFSYAATETGDRS